MKMSEVTELVLPSYWDEGRQKWDDTVFANADENGGDEYGNAIMRYAVAWATTIEEQILEGKQLRDIAKQTSRDVDDEGITGFMYGCVISILAFAWGYGEELRRWHNLDTQIGIEGERANNDGAVLNPALLVIGE